MRPVSCDFSSFLTLLCIFAAPALFVGGCDGSPSGPLGSDRPYPPVNSTPFDRDLPAEADLTTVLQKGDTIFFFGGRDAGGRAVDSVWAFVLGSRRWIARAPMPTPRYYAGAVSVGGKIFLIGGRDNSPSSDAAERLQRTVERYDPVADTWTTLPPVELEGFDASYPTLVAAAEGRIFAISSLRTSRTTWLFESADGITWTRQRLGIPTGIEPTLMSDGRTLFVSAGVPTALGDGFYRVDPETKRAEPDAPGYRWWRGYSNRWIALDGFVYDVNGCEGSDDVLAVYNDGWGFNGVPYDITSNRHFTPIITDRGLGTLYLFAPPQLRIGVHYSTLENRFFTK